MKTIGVFIDVSNLYFTIHTRYGDSKKLDYRKFLDYVKTFGEVQQAIAYGSQLTDEANSFICALERIGFTTKFKTVKTYADGNRKADWDVGITMDVVQMIARLNRLVLGTADGDFEPLVSWARQTGCDVVVIGCGISKELRESATTCIEIPESLLE